MGGGTQGAWLATRAILARAVGYRCHWCRVPTAATLEHVEARNNGGGNDLIENLRLACPYCNSAKSDESVESWTERQGWRIAPPPDLPASVRKMLAEWYGEEAIAAAGRGVVKSGNTNARVRLQGDDVWIEVRPGKGIDWHVMRLGSGDHPKVVRAVWDFLYRHNRRPVVKRKA